MKVGGKIVTYKIVETHYEVDRFTDNRRVIVFIGLFKLKFILVGIWIKHIPLNSDQNNYVVAYGKGTNNSLKVKILRRE